MSAMRLIYVTCKDQVEAQFIAKELLTLKLAACANIFGGMQSVYYWEGQLQNQTETVLLLKTTAHCFSDCQAQIKKLHSYSTPCILELNVCGVNKEYLDWISNQTLPL